MKQLLFISVFLFQFVADSTAQGSWMQKADFLGSARFVAASFSIGTKGYIGTGRDLSGPGFSKDFWEWDQSNDVWTQKADFGGTEKMAAVGFSIGTKGYIATGWDINLVFTNDLWEYDPLNNTWTQKANLPGPGRYRATAFSIGTNGYLGTGYNGATYFNDFWEWDQINDSWTQISDFPGAPRLSPISFSIGTKGYMGTGGDGNFTVNYNDFYEWDQSNDTWIQKADFPGAARMGASAFAIVCKGYVGTGTSGTTYSDFYEYDPISNTWTQQTDFGGGTEAQAVGFAIGNKGYIGTGQNLNNTFWEFTPDTTCLLNSIAVASSDSSVCEKFCIDFFDQSTNNPVSWQWVFEGGIPGTSTQQDPSGICYDIPGMYDVTLVTTDASGSSDTIVLDDFVTVFGTPSTPTITQNGDTLICSSAYSYQWQLNTVDIPGATNQSYIVNQSGLYTVIVADENGCINSADIDFSFTGFQLLAKESLISIYPNPSKGIFTIEISDPIFSIEIINPRGKSLLLREEVIPLQIFKKKIWLNDISNGVYFIKVRTSHSCITKTFVIVK